MSSMNYEYETSPRKQEPNYKQKPNKNKKQEIEKQYEINEQQRKEAVKLEKKRNNQNVIYVIAIFLILLGISYRSSLITERFNELQTSKDELAAIEKTNEQLEVSIESSVNLSTIEEMAEELGMQKLDNSQKVYITLDKKDYVEVSSDEIEITEETDVAWYQKIINKIIGN